MLSDKSKRELHGRRSCLYADLYQTCGSLDLHSLESLCRRLHIIDIKLYAIKGGIYDKENNRY